MQARYGIIARQKATSVRNFAKSAILLFLALRIGDVVNLAAGMWFVPKYVSPEEIGAVLPLTSFATFLSLPVFAFAMTVMKESAVLHAAGERAKVKSLLSGVFAAVGAALVYASAGILVVSGAFLGCVAPVYTDALQSMKRFRSLAAVEVCGSAVRFLAMLATMPFRALAGYFAGQAALPAFRIAGSVIALRRDLSVPAEPYWNRETVRRVTLAFLAVCAYQVAPMAAALVEQTTLRTGLSAVDSAGYYMVSRFSDFLYYLTFPLLLVMFPYTADAARRSASTSPYVLKCMAATLVAAAFMSAAYFFFGKELLSLMPHGGEYGAYAKYMPWLVPMAALTTCQVFHTNAEVSAGRFGFLLWLVPLHVVYAVALKLRFSGGNAPDMTTLLCWFGAMSFLRFACSAISLSIILYISPLPLQKLFAPSLLLLFLFISLYFALTPFAPHFKVFRDPATGLYGILPKHFDYGAFVLDSMK